MNVTDVLNLHIDNPEGARHRMFLQTVRKLRCWDCKHTIELPIFGAQVGTPSPPPFTAPTDPPASPETIARAKQQVAAELAARKQQRGSA